MARFRASGHARYRRRLFVPIIEFVDTSSHHAAFGDRSVVHPVASRKGGPHRRETINVQRIADVLKEWEEPTHEPWGGWTAWRMFNAATFALTGRVMERPD